MNGKDTKQRILFEALRLFARDGYEAVSVESIAAAVGIRAPSLYKHYRSKREIFDSILREMERLDAENAERFSLPTQTKEAAPGTYEGVSAEAVMAFCEQMFRYWTQDEFAAAFRRMLTVEQYRSGEMNALYHQYLGTGPLQYTADLLGSEEAALALYAPMHLLYGAADSADNPEEVCRMLTHYLEAWCKQYCAGASPDINAWRKQYELSAE